TYPLEGFDAYWASPPCQAYTWSAKRWHKEWLDLVGVTRERLQKTGKAFIIENVPQSPLIEPVKLNGRMFGLRLLRERWFECSFDFGLCHPPQNKRGSVKGRQYMTVAGHGGNGSAKLQDWQEAMGIDWMDKQELTQAIPPAYSRFIGEQLMKVLGKGVDG
ncbi:unnamed protein product, partial [marine sediment metagenome]